MATERLLTERDIQTLLDNNSAPPLGRRNTALIMAAVYWGLTPSELSKLTLESVMDDSGRFYRIWVLPREYSYNGESRECRTEDHVLPFFECYVEWRISQKQGISNSSEFRGLNPKGEFLLNDKGEKYKLTLRKKEAKEKQPLAMNQQLKRMLTKAGLHGATPASFRDSYVRGLYENGCGWKDLMLVTGYKQKRTLERKIRPQEAELEKVFRSLFAHVRNPVFSNE